MFKIKKKQIIAVILCLTALFYSSCTDKTDINTEITNELVSTAENIVTTENITDIKETQVKPLRKYYEYSDDFDSMQGPIWYYLSVPAGGAEYNELLYVETEWGYSAWATDKEYLFGIGFITDYEMIPGFNHDSVIAFKAPYTGKIILSSDSGEVRLKDSTGVSDGSVPSDGADFGVFLYSGGNLVKLYPKGEGTANSGMEFLENGETKDFEPLEIDIKKNEMLWIRANSGANGRNDHDSIFFQPVIEYTSIDENDAGIEIAAVSERLDRPAGSNLDPNVFPMVEGKYDDDKIIRTDKYIISGEKDKVLDFTGYKYIVNEFVVEYCYNVTIKNLTLEVSGDIIQVVSGDNIIIDGLRCISKNEGPNFLCFNCNARTVALKNSYIKGFTVLCDTAWIENNVIENKNMIGIQFDLSGGTAIYNTITTGGALGIYSFDTTNPLIALNIIDGEKSIEFWVVKNGVILLNEISGTINVIGTSTNITIAENNFKSDGDNVFLENVDYALGTNNKNLRLSAKKCTNLSGEDFTEYKLLDVGANEDLLPKLNKELFVGMPRKTAVNYGGNSAAVNNYIALKYSTSKYVIIPPGAYAANPINLTGYADYKIYAYGVMCEFENYNTVVQMTDCENIAVKGMYVDFTVPVNGQAVITDISDSDKTITFKIDDGYNQNLLDSNKYALNDTQSANMQWYKQGEKTVSDVATSAVTEINAADGEFSIPKNAFNKAQVGDKLAFRGRDRFVTYFDRCSGMQLEDYTIYSGGGFGFMERNGDKSTVINRMAVIPGPAPLLSDGWSRGADRLTSTCDSTHSTNMRHGPQMTNCLFESATDDGTNINAEFGTVLDFDDKTQIITYTQGNNFYPGMCVDFKKGDRVLIYTKNGELLCDTFAVSDTVTDGNIKTVQIDKGQFNFKTNVTVIQNASASGNGFMIQNTKLYGNWTKGFLIKAIGGEISNCTFDKVGITAIYLCPEIKDGLWNECGYSESIVIKNNLITETGYMYSNDIYSTVINIRSDAGVTSKPEYMMMKNIVVTNNKISGRHTKYALNINGGNDILVENNDWGYMSGKDAESDNQTSVTITTSAAIKLNGNIYPELANPKIKLSQNSTIDIYGSDID